MPQKCSYTTNCTKVDCDKSFCIKKYKLDFLYSTSLLSDVQKKHIDLKVDKNTNIDLEEFKQLKNIELKIEDFISKGKNLYIYSSTSGNAKTSWAIRMIQTHFENIWDKCELACKALFISIPRYLMAIKDNISQKSDYISFIKENIMKADLVIWDDIGGVGSKYSATDFEKQNLLSFIDGRMATGKSNIYTSNLNPEQLKINLGERLSSRICNASIKIELHGKDGRKA